MSKENWLATALIITTFVATLTGPVLATFVQSRLSRPRRKVHKAANPNKHEWQRYLSNDGDRWYVPAVVSTLTTLAVLIAVIWQAKSVTRYSVVMIAAGFSIIVYNVLAMLLVGLHQQIKDLREAEKRKTPRKQSKTVQQ